jgi:hypothetical protein
LHDYLLHLGKAIVGRAQQGGLGVADPMHWHRAQNLRKPSFPAECTQKSRATELGQNVERSATAQVNTTGG